MVVNKEKIMCLWIFFWPIGNFIMGFGIVFEYLVLFCPMKFPDSRKIWNLEFWVKNQGQWAKLCGKNTQYIEIGQN